MRDMMFEVPSDDTISEVLVTKETVVDGKPAEIKRHSEKIA